MDYGFVFTRKSDGKQVNLVIEQMCSWSIFRFAIDHEIKLTTAPHARNVGREQWKAS